MRPFCKKCFFSELDPGGVYNEIKDMIAALPDEKRADDDTYRHRLDICGSCESLGSGICGKCGCFVELRAAKKICTAQVKIRNGKQKRSRCVCIGIFVFMQFYQMVRSWEAYCCARPSLITV